MPSGFAPAPPGAIRSGIAGWKPSGIPSVTVVPTVKRRSVPAFPPVSTQRIPRSSGHVRESRRHPCRGDWSEEK